MDDILLIGEVIEVNGINTRVKVYQDKNISRILYKGKIIKNVAVGNYVKILKGFNEIIAVIEGEYIKELKNIDSFNKHSDTYLRVLELKILGYFNNNRFVKGFYETPMISNYAYVLTEEEVQKIFCFKKDEEPIIQIGNISGYNDYKLLFSIQRLFASHVGIFGNTGSGKSNTLTKIYTELFNSKLNHKKSKFVFIDFNNEYISNNVLTHEKTVYKLDTRTNSGDKFPLNSDIILDSTFWGIILDATEKTQKPFISRVIKQYTYLKHNKFSFVNILRIVHENPSKFNNVKNSIVDLLKNVYGDSSYEIIFDNIEYHSTQYKLCDKSTMPRASYFDNINELEVYLKDKVSSNHRIDIFEEKDMKTIEPIELFDIALKYQYIYETLKGYSNDEHISPMIKRSEKRIFEIKKVIDFKDSIEEENNIQVVSMSNCNVNIKKIVPLLICKEEYDRQKEKNRGNTSLHLIIDEAHNILSENSNRESESWKDYRLEVFEEIIKEGRKFGCFITISSQRPSDISPTLVSQLHNYFIHRLVNEEDLYAIRKSVSFLDRAKQDIIPILSKGQCICSGIALDFPINVQVDELNDDQKPDSNDIDIISLWNNQ